MREIKFRGKREHTREWVYGSLDTNFTLEGIMTISFFDQEGFYCEEKVIPETVGQFTGLTDKNGKEIYDGDIVYHPFLGWSTPVAYSDGRFSPFDAWLDSNCVVIGNIHENGELLK